MPVRGDDEAGLEDALFGPAFFVAPDASRERLVVRHPRGEREAPVQNSKEKEIDTRKKVNSICTAAEERKAEDVVVMEMKDKSSIGEYFVVMSAPSTVRVKAIVDHIEETLESHGFRVLHKEGLNEGVWVLMDYGDILVHVFHEDTRKFYSLETLWGDAPRRHFPQQS